MPTECSYKVEVKGTYEQWDSVVDFISTGSASCMNGMWGLAILRLDNLWPDIDELEYKWIAFNWFQKEDDRLVFRGECKYGPLFQFLIRLSLRFPVLEFRCKALADHVLHEHFIVRTGEITLVDKRELYLREDKTVWYWRDGVELNPPEEVYESDDPIVPDAPDTYEV